MTNQSLMLVSIVLCSLGGWYVVLTKYLELKAMSINKSDNHDQDHVRIEPVSSDFHSMPVDFDLNHAPGMGPPPHPKLPFEIPDDLIAAMNKLRPTSKLETSTAASQETTTARASTTQPVASPQKREICNWASILHLSGFTIVTGIPFLNIIIPSILWLMKKEQHPFLAKQGRDVINFQITFTLIQFLCLGMGALFIWLAPITAQALFTYTKTLRIVFGTSLHFPCNIFTVVPFFWGCIVMVRGAVAAYSGSTYKYPYSQPFLFVNPQPQVKPKAKAPQAKVSSQARSAPVFNNMNYS